LVSLASQWRRAFLPKPSVQVLVDLLDIFVVRVGRRYALPQPRGGHVSNARWQTVGLSVGLDSIESIVEQLRWEKPLLLVDALVALGRWLHRYPIRVQASHLASILTSRVTCTGTKSLEKQSSSGEATKYSASSSSGSWCDLAFGPGLIGLLCSVKKTS
jgi:hypothetical protein